MMEKQKENLKKCGLSVKSFELLMISEKQQIIR